MEIQEENLIGNVQEKLLVAEKVVRTNVKKATYMHRTKAVPDGASKNNWRKHGRKKQN